MASRLDGRPRKTKWHLLYATSSFVDLSPYVNSNWSYSPETANLVFFTSVTLTFDLWPWLFMDFTSVNGNSSWKFHDDTVMGTYSIATNRRTDCTIHRVAWSQLKIFIPQSEWVSIVRDPTYQPHISYWYVWPLIREIHFDWEINNCNHYIAKISNLYGHISMAV